MIREYVKNDKHNPYKRTGVMLAFVVPNAPDEICIGFAKCHTKLDKFDRNLGEQIALGRAFNYLYHRKNPKVPHSMKSHLKNFAKRVTRYYKQATVPEWIGWL